MCTRYENREMISGRRILSKARFLFNIPIKMRICLLLLSIKLSKRDSDIYEINNHNMKKSKTIYWVLTAAISSFMLFSAWYSGTHAVEFDQRLRFPEYFRIELTIAKIIGAIVLLFPQVPVRIKEWIYV